LTIAVFAALLLLTGLMRLIEVWVSVRRMRAPGAHITPEPVLFAAMAALHTGFVTLPLVEVLLWERPFVPWLAGLSVAVLAAATALRWWTLRTLGRSWNVRVVVAEDMRIVTGGPYRWIRHPNYLVVILEIAALPLFHNAWVAATILSLVNAAVLARRIPTEEAALSAFPAWREAMEHKKRLIPGVL